MQRRAASRNINSHFAPHEHEANHCRAIVPVNGEGIRKKLKKDYNKALRDVEKARRQLDQYHRTDLPEFTRWLNSHFGALLTELRELSQKLAADQELAFQVESEVLFGGGSYARAYQRVMRMRENPEPVGDENEAGNGNRARPEPENAAYEEDPIEALFNEIFGKSGKRNPEGDSRDHRPNPRDEPRMPVQESARLKQLYRAVVRRLHPDTQQEMTAQTTEWWHQAQAAYAAGDADQLEVILTLCEIEASGTTAQTSASLLQRITAQLKSSLRGMRRQIRDWRGEPAWNFSQLTDREAITGQTLRQLTRDLVVMREQARYLRERIAGWKSAAERLKPPRRRKNQPRSPNVPF